MSRLELVLGRRIHKPHVRVCVAVSARCSCTHACASDTSDIQTDGLGDNGSGRSLLWREAPKVTQRCACARANGCERFPAQQMPGSRLLGAAQFAGGFQRSSCLSLSALTRCPVRLGNRRCRCGGFAVAAWLRAFPTSPHTPLLAPSSRSIAFACAPVLLAACLSRTPVLADVSCAVRRRGWR